MPQTLHAFLDVGTPIPGPPGPPGAPGEPTNILAPVPTEGDLPPEGERGDAVLTEDSGDLWSWNTPESTGTVPRPGTTADEYQWINVGHVVGPPGAQGDKGDTGAASTVPGPQGPKGDKGDPGDPASQTPWTQSVDADGHDLQDLNELDFRNASGSNGFTYIASDHNQMYAGSQNNGLMWHVNSSTKVATFYGPVTTEGGPVEAKTTGFKFPDGTTQSTALTKAQAQTPWTQDISAASFSLTGLKQLTVTGSNVAGADAAAGVNLNRGYDAVGDSMDLVWGPGPNRLGRLSMTLWGGGESAFVFHAQTAGGDGGNNEVLRVQGNKRILATAEVDIKGWGDGEGGDLRLCDVDGTPNWAVDVDSGNMLRIHRLGTLVLRISPSFVIQMLLGGSLKTLSVDGSGFVKAA